MSLKIVLTLCLVLFIISETHELSIDEAYDIECIKPHPKVARNVDYAWMLTVPKWYIPLQSKLNLYRYTETLFQTPISNLTQDQVDKVVDPSDSCITFKWQRQPKLFGYGNREVTYTTTMVIENTYGFVNMGWKEDTRGRHYFTLKDNKSFLFFATCWADGKASWSVISTTPTLTDELRKQLLDHAQSWGFNVESQNLVVEQKYDDCDLRERDEGVTKNEL